MTSNPDKKRQGPFEKLVNNMARRSPYCTTGDQRVTLFAPITRIPLHHSIGLFPSSRPYNIMRHVNNIIVVPLHAFHDKLSAQTTTMKFSSLFYMDSEIESMRSLCDPTRSISLEKNALKRQHPASPVGPGYHICGFIL